LARIAGIDLPRDKRVEYGLTYIYGVGVSTSREILAEAAVNPDTRVRDLTDAEVSRIQSVITGSHEVSQSIKRLMDIGCHRGLRHRRGLPVRGQRTRTNARTRKGPRKTIAGKKQTKAKK
jgi:small subunit ribosomal protein S13